MSVNQKVKNLSKNQKNVVKNIASALGISTQAVHKKISAEKEINDVDFIKAAAKVLNKPFTYFVDIGIDLQGDNLKNYDEIVKKLEAALSENELLRKENSVLKDKLINLQEGIIKFRDNL